MPTPSADANLLFGILALQNNFITREALLAAFAAWVADKSNSIGDLLVNAGKLTSGQHAALVTLIAELLAQPGNSPESCLSRLSSIDSVRIDLNSLCDPDLEASLLRVSQNKDLGNELLTLSLDKTIGNRSGGGTRFRILRPHARGGLGEVFVAHDVELGREVALKEIQLDKSSDLDARSRFRREGEITGCLEHPSIVPVYGLGQYDDGRPYYAMRFIKGDSLKDSVRAFHAKHSPDGTHARVSQGSGREPSRAAEKNLELRQLLQRFIDVCEAIEYAHSRGVLHRDLKPGNIMLGKYGETLVVDWGLAKVNTSEDGGSLPLNHEGKLRVSSGDLSATIMGSRLGTPQFMPPEQAQGRLDLLGPRSDVYSLGATLYTVLTGKPPVNGRSLEEVLEQVIAGEIVAPRVLDRSVPRPLEAVCLKALAREPVNRYASAKLLKDDLEKWLADEPVQAISETTSERLGRWARRNRHWVQAGGLTMLLVATTAIAAYFQQRDMATANRDLASEKEQLANTNERLANLEKAARREAEVSARSFRVALAQNHFGRGIDEYAAGRVGSGTLDLQKAWSLLPEDTTLKSSYQRVLFDRCSRGGRSPSLVMRHPGGVRAVAISSQGDRIVTGGTDNTAQLWDAQTGMPLGEPLRHGDLVQEVAFSPAGDRILTASRGTVRLWQATTCKSLGEPMQHGDMVLAISFCPNGDRVLTASSDNTARLWDAYTGASIGVAMRHEKPVVAATFCLRGERVATCSLDNTARLWDAHNGKPLGVRMQHDDEVMAIRISPEGDRILTAGYDRTARIWDARSGQPIGRPMKHTSTVMAIDFSPQGDSVLTGSMDGIVQFWDATTGSPLWEPLSLDNSILDVAFSPTGDRYLTVCYDRTVLLWERNNSLPIIPPIKHDDFITAVAFTPLGDHIVTASDDGTARIWNTQARSTVTQATRPSFVKSVAFSPSGEGLLIGSLDDTVAVRDTRTFLPLEIKLRHERPILAVAFSPLGGCIATGDWDGTARIWSIDSDEQLVKPIQHGERILAVAFSPDGKCILTGGRDGAARLWSASTGLAIGRSMQHGNAVYAVAFSPHGDRILTGSADSTSQLWDAKSTTRIGRPIQHEGIVCAVAFSPRRDRIATSNSEGVTQLWDAQTGMAVGAPIRQADRVGAVAFSPDGERLVTGSDDNAARCWDEQTGVQLGETMWHEHEVDAVAFSPHTEDIVTAAGEAYLWSNQTLPLPADLKCYVELVTGASVDTSGDIHTLTSQQRKDRLRSFAEGERRWLTSLTDSSTARVRPYLMDCWRYTLSRGNLLTAQSTAQYVPKDHQLEETLKLISYVQNADSRGFRNSGFEQISRTAAVPFWRVDFEANSGSKAVIEGLLADGSSESCLKLRTYDKSEWLFCSQIINVTPNTHYLVKCRVKVNNVSAAHDNSGGACIFVNGIGEVSAGLRGTHDWTDLKADVFAGDFSLLEVGPSLGSKDNPAEGTAWFDDIQITELCVLREDETCCERSLRSKWRYAGGEFRHVFGDVWIEETHSGFLPFRERRRQEEFVELYDKGGKFDVRLCSERMLLKQPTETDYQESRSGQWVKASEANAP